MKISTYIAIASLSTWMTISACNTKKEDPSIPQSDQATTTDSTGQQHQLASTPSGDNTLQHFYCPNHCKGSGGPEDGTCPVCGTAYVHNDAFDQGKPVHEPAMRIDPVTHMAVPTHTEAQNAHGVYHFICPNGDPGGAGVAGNCSKCGAALVHNQAFHQP